MTTYSKPAVRSSWGEAATGSDLQDPGNTYASAGWQLGVKPPRQYFNWVLNYVFAAVRYFCQTGIPTWDVNESYHNGSITTSPGGVLYRGLAPGNINPDTSGPDQSHWDVPYVPTAPGSDNTVRAANTAWVRGYALPIGSTFIAINGQLSNAQVPVGAVTQWQGSLSIAGSQVSSAVARANTLQLVGSTYATFTWSGQSGQPAWLFGSNDGANVLVWNPSNFSVANSQALQGLTPNSAAAGNTVVTRDANGYVYAGYFNQSSSNNENPAISQIMVTNGGDNYFRKAGFSYVASNLITQFGFLTGTAFGFSSGGWQKIGNSQGIIQGGRVSVSGASTVFFPLAFPHACLGVAFTNEGSTNQIFISSPPSASFFQTANGSAVINYVAFGW